MVYTKSLFPDLRPDEIIEQPVSVKTAKTLKSGRELKDHEKLFALEYLKTGMSSQIDSYEKSHKRPNRVRSTQTMANPNMWDFMAKQIAEKVENQINIPSKNRVFHNLQVCYTEVRGISPWFYYKERIAVEKRNEKYITGNTIKEIESLVYFRQLTIHLELCQYRDNVTRWLKTELRKLNNQIASNPMLWKSQRAVLEKRLRDKGITSNIMGMVA